ncbi:hypothetical protein IWQ62_001208 [Dispira parvispora]|uniref:Amino acid transporter transmembrane domain-containing protein n=1 Tax=Dispira parvispora TaxID=1520584 RepID=A0A9W8AT41_9FUNG|nr:hypothetical protein IWQ62_001208 [Dispira parvispora]
MTTPKGKDDTASSTDYEITTDTLNEKQVVSETGDGHDHESKGSSFGAFFNIVCVIAGTGTLQLPYAFAQGGWISMVLLILAGFFAYFTGCLMVKCLYSTEGKRMGSYPEIGLASFGKIGKYVVLVLHYSICLGSACVYINVAGGSVYELAKAIDIAVPFQLWIIIAALLVWLPFAFVKSMKEVAILAIFGVVATIVMIVVVVVMGLIDIPNQLENKHSVANWLQLPTAMGSICFAFGGNVVFPHVESAMKNPHSFNKVLLFSILAILGMYMLIAIVGYQVYGETVKPLIYNSVPANISTTIAILMLVAHVILAAPIMLTTFALEIEESYNFTVERLGKAKEFTVRLILRSATVVILTIPAMFLPVDMLMSLVGSLSNSLIIYVLPIVCYWRLYGIRSMNWFSLLLCGVCILMATAACIFGTMSAVKDLVIYLQK